MTHVIEVADARLRLAQPSFGDSYLASTIHIVDVGDGSLKLPHPKVGNPQGAGERDGGLGPPCPMVSRETVASMSRKSTYTSGHVIEVGNGSWMPPCPKTSEVLETSEVVG